MEKEKRNKLFKFVCIPLRILIIVLLVLFSSNGVFRSVAAVLCFMVFATFSIKYINKDMVGGFGGYAWWHSNRPWHALFYLTTGILLVLEYEWAGYVLVPDVLLGIVTYTLKENANVQELKDTIPEI